MNTLTIPVDISTDIQEISVSASTPQEIAVSMDMAVIIEGDTPPVLIEKQINENGTYSASADNADGYSSVDVYIAPPTLIAKSVTDNGTYYASDDDANGYSSVDVNVPSVVPVLITKSITENGVYDASLDDADGYSVVDVNVEQGLIIPDGYSYYNGYLLPTLPIIEGYDFVWIRMNNSTNMWNAIYGASSWYALSSSSLATWTLTFNNQASLLSRQYDTPQSNPTVWTESAPSANNYGTGSDRKPIWTNEDIYTSSAKNVVLLKQGFAITSA